MTPAAPIRLCAALFLWACLALTAQAQETRFFEVDTLNEGLPEPPQSLDRDTPQSAMEALLDLVAAGQPGLAAHLLDLRDVPPEEQPERGARLAADLVDVLQRKAVINWTELLERPDALDANANAESPVAGQVQRSILIDVVETGKRPVAIRLNRLKPADGDAVWVFSRQTVANIPRLHALYGPTWFEEELPDLWRVETFWDLRRWELVALPAMLALVGGAGWAAGRAQAMLARRVRSRLATDVLRATRMPIILATCSAILLVLSNSLFIFSGRINSVLGPMIALGFTAAALIFVMNGVDAVLNRIVPFEDDTLSDPRMEARRNLATRIAAWRRVLIVAIVLIGGAIVLSEAQFFGGLGLSILASAGALTLLIGFAARHILGNILASLQIAMNRSAKIGDKLEFRGHICTVERINFTYVQLLDWTGVRLVVPVSEFVAEHFENWTMNDPSMIRTIKVKLAHDTEVQPLREAFFEIIDEQDPKEVQDRDQHFVMVADQDVFGQEVWFCLACAKADTAWMLSCEVREALLDRARAMARDGRPMFPRANPAEAA
ncbi:mechanosensitive ion channel family protein [Limimaricola pyoseonensis]|uniref:Mechanosensitive ion channel n=1 Tax=Limimaricola pyoseonensis TaxID=521013 RepID=A0A1G7H209_9RHOB|nr:mechanosensitive ion channel domain-containing protein [Limimaricola pyoseonensis]SDE94447.1 Mechanosensitive ion channel [Limimaricola pyoseonensis]